MGRKRRKGRSGRNSETPVDFAKGGKPLTVILCTSLLLILAAVACLYHFSRTDFTGNPIPLKGIVGPEKFTRKARALDGLLAMTAQQLAQVDIAEMNLLCAT